MNNKPAPNSSISFREFLSLEKMFRNKAFNEQVWKGYIRVSSYILNNEHINIAKVNNHVIIKNLYEKLREDKDFMKDNIENRELCLLVLERFVEYVKYIEVET